MYVYILPGLPGKFLLFLGAGWSSLLLEEILASLLDADVKFDTFSSTVIMLFVLQKNKKKKDISFRMCIYIYIYVCRLMKKSQKKKIKDCGKMRQNMKNIWKEKLKGN